MMARLTGLWFATATLLCAQAPGDLFTKAPPAIDTALRERITAFFQAHVDGKFRLADQYVAEESKDGFFEADKRRCRAFEIARINYEEGFEKATAVVSCDTEMLMPPAGLVRLKMPLTSFWKVAAGQWVWYLPPRDNQSPFGPMKPGEGEGSGAVKVPTGPSVREILEAVKVDRKSLQVEISGKYTSEITVTNHLPGQVKLTLTAPNCTDIQAELEKTELAPNEATKLTIRYAYDPAMQRRLGSAEDVRISVSPTNAVIPVRVLFANP